MIKKFVGFKKKYYFCTMKNAVDIFCFSSGKRLEMRMFDGLRGWVRLAGRTVDNCRYGRTFAGIRAFAANEDSTTRKHYGSEKHFLGVVNIFWLIFAAKHIKYI